MNKEAAKVRKVIDEVEESKEPFKMACWEKVEPKIKVKELEEQIESLVWKKKYEH